MVGRRVDWIERMGRGTTGISKTLLPGMPTAADITIYLDELVQYRRRGGELGWRYDGVMRCDVET